jgi:hypothetical protein
MLDLSKRDKYDPEDRKVIFLELLAAMGIFSIVIIVLYMVFTYKPT